MTDILTFAENQHSITIWYPPDVDQLEDDVELQNFIDFVIPNFQFPTREYSISTSVINSPTSSREIDETRTVRS